MNRFYDVLYPALPIFAQNVVITRESGVDAFQPGCARFNERYRSLEPHRFERVFFAK